MRMIRIITQIMRLIDVIKLMRIMRIIILLLYIHFHHFVNINNSDYSNLFLPLPVYPNFAVVPDEPPSHEQQPLHDSSWFVVDEPTQLSHALCKPNAHTCRAPPRNDIDRSWRSRWSRQHGGPTVRAAVAVGSLTPDWRRARIEGWTCPEFFFGGKRTNSNLLWLEGSYTRIFNIAVRIQVPWHTSIF